MLQTLGRYEVLRPIATGGMATVYLGRVSAAGGFERLSRKFPRHAGLLHFLGEVEVVFGFWAMVLLVAMAWSSTSGALMSRLLENSRAPAWI